MNEKTPEIPRLFRHGVNDNNKNRRTHGDSLRMLDEVSSSNKNPPALAVGSVNEAQRLLDNAHNYYEEVHAELKVIAGMRGVE